MDIRRLSNRGSGLQVGGACRETWMQRPYQKRPQPSNQYFQWVGGTAIDRADRPRTDVTRFGAAWRGFARIWRKMSSEGGSDDFDAALAERCGWINRTVPDQGFEALVEQFARRVASLAASQSGRPSAS